MVTSIENSNNKRKGCRFNYNKIFLIGKHAAIHGPIAAVKKFKTSHPHLKFGESTARSLRERYHNNFKSSERSTVIQKNQVEYPLTLGAIDHKVHNFLMILMRKEEFVNAFVANATAQVLIESRGTFEKHHP